MRTEILMIASVAALTWQVFAQTPHGPNPPAIEPESGALIDKTVPPPPASAPQELTRDRRPQKAPKEAASAASTGAY